MPFEKIFHEGKEIILLGTAHVSEESVSEVLDFIERESPDAIGVELDELRARQLLESKKWQDTDIGEIIRKGQANLFLLTILLSSIQKRIGLSMGIKPGEEMLAAMKKAWEKQKPLYLLDRNVNVTMSRAFHSMGFIEKLKLFLALIEGFFGFGEKVTKEKIEELKKTDVLTTLINEMSMEMPAMKKVLVDERDSYIAKRIISIPEKKILAVVGAGHLYGIKQRIQNGNFEFEETKQENKKSFLSTFFPYFIPLVFIAMVFLIFLNNGFESLLKAGLYWILITGSFASLGALIARAHPYSIIAAFLSAPLTTLHPLIAVGFVVGYVEAKVRTPKVKDFEDLQDIKSLKQISENQVSRIILAVALSNLGATIGSFIGLGAISTLI